MEIISKNKYQGRIIAISISKERGVKKINVPEAILIENYGIKNDAHAGDWHRQISLLDISSINLIKNKLPGIKPGDFAENITTEGLELFTMPVGTLINIGEDCLIQLTQIGKECKNRCIIFYTVGDCIMPKQGVFARVLKGGKIKVGDVIKVK